MELIGDLIKVLTLTEKFLSAKGISELIVLVVITFILKRNNKSLRELVSSGPGHVRTKTASTRHDVVINEALGHLVFCLGASRAFVFQRHNGDYNAVTGMSFKKLSMTHEFVEPGASVSAKDWQNIPLGMFAAWYEHIRIKRELFIDDARKLQASDTSGFQILRDNNVGSLYLVGLFGFGHEEPIAFVGVCFKKQTPLSKEQASSLRAASMKLCGCLLAEDGK